MTIIEPGQQRHRCRTPGSTKPKDEWLPRTVFMVYEIGTLWRCDHCHRWWHAADAAASPRGPYVGGGRIWRPVRWWHLRLRRRISGYVAEHSYCGPGTYFLNDTPPRVTTAPLESPPPLT